MSGLDYNPPPTLLNFMRSDARGRFVTGPVGSGKTTAMIVEMLRRAAMQAPGRDGIRRTRWTISRNTLPQIKQTCVASIEQLLNPILKMRVSESKIIISGGDIHTEWLLLPLERPEDQRRLLSLELTGAWVSEFREVNPDLVRALMSRVGRYPSKIDGGCTWYGVIAESNGFSIASPWYELLEDDRPTNWDYFRQPSGVSDEAENVENLPPDYYPDMMANNSDDWVRIHVYNEYGDDLSGQAVFRNTFSADFHVADGPLTPSEGHVLTIGMDFARAPAAIIGQMNHVGRVMCLKELFAENMGVEAFVRDLLLPELHSERFRRLPSYIVGDPSGRQRSQIGEMSVFDLLKKYGFEAIPAQTNAIDPRLRAVEQYLLQQRQAGPAIVFDPVGCPMLIKAMREKYRYKIKPSGEMHDKPEKERPWADLADALQYMCLGLNASLRGRAMARVYNTRNNFEETPPVASWT